MIEFSCPHCTKQFRVKDDSAAGRTGTCPHCGGSVTIPGKASETEPQQASPPPTPALADPANLKFLGWSIGGVIALGVLFLLASVAESLTKAPEPSGYYDRFRSDYADSATANAVESIESNAEWFVKYGTSNVEFWLIIVAFLLVLVLVQTERLIAAIRRP